MSNSTENSSNRPWVVPALVVSACVVLAIAAAWAFLGSGTSNNRSKNTNATSTPVDTTTLAIRPGEGVGPLSFGTDREAIVAAFGEPSVSKKSNAFDTLEYPELGFWLLYHDDKGLLQFNGFHESRARVIGGSTSYSGKTTGGIGIGSSKEAVRDAFGEPETGSGTETWGYKSPRISFEFEEDQVVGIGMTWNGRKPAGKK